MNRKLNTKKIEEYINYKPNAWQKEVRKVEARFKILCIGRRAGKTYYVTRDPIDGLVGDLFKRDQLIWVVAPTYDQTQRIWDDLYHLCISKFKPLIYKITNTKGSYRIQTKLGTVIEAKSAKDPETLVGVGLNKLIIDEAASVDEKAWYQSLLPALADRKGTALFIGTPKGKNWFWKEFQRGQLKEDGFVSWSFPSWKNEHIDKAELKALAKNMPEIEYRQEILAEFIEGSGSVFRNIFDIRGGIPVSPIAGHEYVIGIDLARVHDFTVLTVIDRETHHVVHMDRFNMVDWSLQKDRIRALAASYNDAFCVIDSTGIGDPITEDLIRTGLSVDDFKYTNKSKKQLIDKLSIFIDEKRIRVPKDYEEIFRELETFGYDITPSGNIRYNAPSGFHDDCVNSLALAVWPLYDPAKPTTIEEHIEQYAYTSDTF